jgi:hypothetical protein
MKRQPIQKQYSDDAAEWIQIILEKNKSIGYFNQNILEKFLFSCMTFSMNTLSQNLQGA